ncbi:MAG TPA: hypothetical protein VGP92_16965 [Acidimicrobiia bacterium]|nr:hypothetical protein [Acidimicrobiia bacterium]
MTALNAWLSPLGVVLAVLGVIALASYEIYGPVMLDRDTPRTQRARYRLGIACCAALLVVTGLRMLAFA